MTTRDDIDQTLLDYNKCFDRRNLKQASVELNKLVYLLIALIEDRDIANQPVATDAATLNAASFYAGVEPEPETSEPPKRKPGRPRNSG